MKLMKLPTEQPALLPTQYADLDGFERVEQELEELYRQVYEELPNSRQRRQTLSYLERLIKLTNVTQVELQKLYEQERERGETYEDR